MGENDRGSFDLDNPRDRQLVLNAGEFGIKKAVSM